MCRDRREGYGIEGIRVERVDAERESWLGTRRDAVERSFRGGEAEKGWLDVVGRGDEDIFIDLVTKLSWEFEKGGWHWYSVVMLRT